MTTPARSASRIIPSLRYRDAPAAIDWLCRVFGFERHLVVPDERGGIVHAQLTLGGGMVMLGSDSPTPPWSELIRSPDMNAPATQCLCIVVPDVDRVYAQVQQAGGRIVDPVADKEYGGRGFGCRDPQGQLWFVGSYDPWADPATAGS